MSSVGHGPNIGHGFVKYVVIDRDGHELPPAVFPAMIGRAGKQVLGAVAKVETVDHAGIPWWTGEDALLAPTPITFLAQDRLHDPIFVPSLVRGALQRLGYLNGAATGACVSGLPATWAADLEKAKLLGERLRAGHAGYTTIRVIPEPLGLLYAAALDNHGQLVGDPGLLDGVVGIIDIGHHTLDLAVLRKLVPIPTSLDTYALGTARPLQQIRAQVSAVFERELSLFEVDQAVRARSLVVAGKPRMLPSSWDAPLLHHGEVLAARLTEAWGSGAQLDVILIGGGGAELLPLVAAIQERYPHAQVIPKPQTAIARGYARLARRLSQPK
jgi:hypothetical protein